MKIFEVLKNDYFRLFVKREGKVVLGRNYSNLWLLTAVLTATFLAIAFSNASLNYLSYKMDDPFINWVDIKNEYGEGDFIGLEYALDSDENREYYHYSSFQADQAYSYMFFLKDKDAYQYFKCRFFQDLNTPLVEAILSKDNVVRNWRVSDLSSVSEKTIGVIITEEMMKKLGYDSAPSFIDFQSYSPGADAYGFHLVEEEFARVPVPVLAVVKNLPGNVDFVSTVNFHIQVNNDYTYPFNLGHSSRYIENLNYFIPAGTDMEKFRARLADIAANYTDAAVEIDEYSFYIPEIVPFTEGDFITLNCYEDYLSHDEWQKINDELLEDFMNKGIYRVYAYEFSEVSKSQKAFISVYFDDLDMIREFEQYVRSEFSVKIEMTQINAKENFNAVSLMGNTLSWVIIIFAIVCIILFIVNLLQSYFSKVKRNLGTFKAFGISNHDLISVYVLIMAGIILSAIVMSVSVSWLVQGLLHIFGILKDGVFDYLSLWSVKTVCSICVIIASSVYTVYAVMHKLLKSTPGDLIYDRQ